MEIQTLQVGYIPTNCYILCDEATRSCAVIDPGGDADQIEVAVRISGCTPCAIFLTHGHDDHVGAVQELMTIWPEIPVYINERDRYLDKPDAWELFPPIQGDKIDNYDEGDTFQIGNLLIRVLATPGHSAGSVTLQCGDVLFTGDTLFASSCGRTDFLGGSTDDIMKSLKRLAQLPGNYDVFPGHMSATSLDRERRKNPYMIHALSLQ